jgi:hypothetical protein
VHSIALSEKLGVIGEIGEKLFRVALGERFGECDLGGTDFFSSICSANRESQNENEQADGEQRKTLHEPNAERSNPDQQ